MNTLFLLKSLSGIRSFNENNQLLPTRFNQTFKYSLTLLLGLFFTVSIFAQNTTGINWRAMGNNKNADFYQIQANFNEYWKDKTPQKGQGYKVFKRWETWMAPRVFPSGNISLASTNYENYMRWKASTTGDRSFTPNDWSPLGPQGVPQGYDAASGRVDFVRFHPSNNNIIYVGAPDGGLWKSTDGGNSWSTNTDFLTIIGCSDLAIDPSNTQIMYLATGNWETDRRSIGVLKSTDGGNTWNTTSLSWTALDNYKIRKMLMHPTNPSVMMVATDGGIFRTTDGWATNENIVCCPSLYDLDFKPGDPNTVYACGSEFWKSYDGGQSWEMITEGLPSSGDVSRMVMAVTPADDAYVYLIAGDQESGYLGTYRSTDGGESFTLQSDSPNILNAAKDATGTGGQALHDLAIAVSPTDENEVTIGGVNMWKSFDGGETWDIIAYWLGNDPEYPGQGDAFPDYVHADIQDIQYLPGSSTTMFATCDGGIFKTTNGGDNWTNLSNNLSIAQQTGIALSSTNPSLVVAGLQDIGTLKYNAGVWSGINGGDGEDAFIHRSNDNIIVSSNPNGNHVISFDGGLTADPILGLPDGEWFSRLSQDPVVETTVYVGGRPELYRKKDLFTNNDGVWEILGTPPGTGGILKYEVSPSDNSIIYAMKHDAVSVSTDAGLNWDDITGDLPVADAQLSSLAISNTDPDVAWVTFSGYSDGNKVFFSTDGGETWSNRSAGLPNLPINTVVTVNNSPTNEVYIGADLGIYYLDNAAGGSWAAFNNNLPNVAVTDLEIFYPENKIRASTYGRGAWESELATPLTSSKDKAQKEEFVKIYPNPSQDGWYNLELTTPSAELVTVEITNAAGQFISTSKLRNSGGVRKIHVPAPGIYLVAITLQDGKTISKKLVSFK